MITKDQILQWLEALAKSFNENKDYLTELDAAIGDADHGSNMSRGFHKVREILPTVADQDLGTIFKTVSMTLISTVGGASGPLYGSFFLKASATAAGKEQLTSEELGNLLQTAVQGVIQRGKASLGDKTMIDVLVPAVGRYQEAIAREDTIQEALFKTVTTAETEMKNTIPLVAKKGRASYLGPRSAGHQDPGATSCYLILKALLETVKDDS
ncbi:dihydroxyacetone kinase subunit DhaL [Gloeothece verrucosa]|uniref:Dihydroxyacetone kinase, L subunit n=1 Tax=Gloeothece verrucosa (strain PCC 7822) TaxID=497965 RepID=E0U9C1_GLOV7|nr:dihydroxyacetone kinase subunit DhaL [Gloeothece verrucosa]ADN12613.1 dihydroxyacetone kinase, L subunit [Gloeothece verrucosa PCC 7822]